MGGTIWKIQHDLITMIYAGKFSHKRELHVEGMELDDKTSQINLLLMNSIVQKNSIENFGIKELVKLVREKIRAGGTVLVPCEPAGRTLEWYLTFA